MEFNNFFIQSVEELAQIFDPTTFNKNEMEGSPDSFYIRKVDETKISEILGKLSSLCLTWTQLLLSSVVLLS